MLHVNPLILRITEEKDGIYIAAVNVVWNIVLCTNVSYILY